MAAALYASRCDRSTIRPIACIFSSSLVADLRVPVQCHERFCNTSGSVWTGIVMGEMSQPFAAPEERPAAPPLAQVPFQANVELLQLFLTHREDIVERIQGVLNAQRKPIQYLQDRRLLSRHFEDCFFTLTGVTHDQTRLRGQLQEAHWASGFRPRQVPGLHNDLIDPAEMMIRGFVLLAADALAGSQRPRALRAHAVQLVCDPVARAVESCASGMPDRAAPANGSRKFKACSTSSGEPHQPISR